MFLIVFVLNIVLVSGLLAIDPGYYIDSNIKEERMYFPKSDTEYIDYLTEKEGAEANYELAIAHLKLERKDIAEKYIKLYEKEENDLKKLINYYRLSGNYVKIEEVLKQLLEKSDEETKIKYKISIEREAKLKGLPIELENYKVSNVEKLYILRNNDEKFKTYFNSEDWTISEMNELLEMLRYQDIPKGTSIEKLFEMFATDRDKLNKKYLVIDGIEDTRGYRAYFDYANELGIEPEIKSEKEKDYYLKYRGEVIEVKNIDVEVATDIDPRIVKKEDSEEANLLLDKDIKEYEKEIKTGNLDNLNEYVNLLKKGGIEGVEEKLASLTRESYIAYRLEKGLDIEKGDMKLGATYLFEKEDLTKLVEYKEYLTEEQLGVLAIKNKTYKDFYRKKYPLNSENIDRRKPEYFYFAKAPEVNSVIVESLLQKRHLEPQERYYLAVYYHKKKDYIKSYRETDQLFRRYKLSDEIFKLHAKNIQKLKDAEKDLKDSKTSKELQVYKK